MLFFVFRVLQKFASSCVYFASFFKENRVNMCLFNKYV